MELIAVITKGVSILMLKPCLADDTSTRKVRIACGMNHGLEGSLMPRSIPKVRNTRQAESAVMLNHCGAKTAIRNRNAMCGTTSTNRLEIEIMKNKSSSLYEWATCSRYSDKVIWSNISHSAVNGAKRATNTHKVTAKLQFNIKSNAMDCV